MVSKRHAYTMGLPKYTLMSLVVTCLSVSADQLKQKPQTLNFSPTKNAQLDGPKPDVVPIFFYARDGSLDGDYNFKYETGNGIYAEERGVMTNKGTENEANAVVGTYRYTSPEGIPIEVTYTAGVDGFKAYGAHLPVGPAAVPAYATRSSPYPNAKPTPSARPQYRTDSSETAAPYPQPTFAPVETEAVAPVQSSAIKTSAAEYYPLPQQAVTYPPQQAQSVTYPTQQAQSVTYPPQQAQSVTYPPQPQQTVTYPPQQQAAVPQSAEPAKTQQFVQSVEPAKTAQPQAVQNSLVARPADYYPPPPQQFQQLPALYPRPQQEFVAPTTAPQPQQTYPTIATSQPTGRGPTAVQRVVQRPVFPGAQQQWFNPRPASPLPPPGYGPQQRFAPALRYAVEPQQVRYVPQGQYYQAPTYAQRIGPEPPRY